MKAYTYQKELWLKSTDPTDQLDKYKNASRYVNATTGQASWFQDQLMTPAVAELKTGRIPKAIRPGCIMNIDDKLYIVRKLVKGGLIQVFSIITGRSYVFLARDSELTGRYLSQVK